MNHAPAQVLLVEDNTDEATLILRTLKKCHEHGQVLRMKDGVEALDYLLYSTPLKQSSSLPKLILLDVNMPRVSGPEVLDKIRANERTRAIPVVVMVSSVTAPDIQTCLTKGANGYLVKPIRLDDYITVAQQLGLHLSISSDGKNDIKF